MSMSQEEIMKILMQVAQIKEENGEQLETASIIQEDKTTTIDFQDQSDLKN